MQSHPRLVSIATLKCRHMTQASCMEASLDAVTEFVNDLQRLRPQIGQFYRLRVPLILEGQHFVGFTVKREFQSKAKPLHIALHACRSEDIDLEVVYKPECLYKEWVAIQMLRRLNEIW